MSSWFLVAGSLYKSFLVTSATTVDDLVAQALNKANMAEQDAANYTIMEVFRGQSIHTHTHHHMHSHVMFRHMHVSAPRLWISTCAPTCNHMHVCMHVWANMG